MSIRGNWDPRRAEAVSRMGVINRRRFVKLTGASAAAMIFGYGPFTEEIWAQPAFSGYPFRLGVASADPEPDGVVLWARLAPEPLADNGFGGMSKDRAGKTVARPGLEAWATACTSRSPGYCRTASTSTGSGRAPLRTPSAGPRRRRPPARASRR